MNNSLFGAGRRSIEPAPADMSTAPRLSVCVFCGASSGDSPLYTEVAYELGKQLGVREHRLIYGAGGSGLMGAVARGVSEQGAKVVGVIPSFLREREMAYKLLHQEVIITRDLARRKSTMMYLADGFIALPGGYGTLDETLEVMSMNAFGLEQRPLVLLNPNGFWDTFVEFIDELARHQFLPSYKYLTIADTPEQAVGHIELSNAASPARQPRHTRNVDLHAIE